MELHPDDHVMAISSPNYVTVRPGVSVREAARALEEANVEALVVVPDRGRHVGVISERDIVRAVAEGVDVDRATAADVMTEEPRYVTPGQSIRSAAWEMLAIGARHIPIIEEAEVVGMVAARDALNVLAGAPSADGRDADGDRVRCELTELPA